MAVGKNHPMLREEGGGVGAAAIFFGAKSLVELKAAEALPPKRKLRLKKSLASSKS